MNAAHANQRLRELLAHFPRRVIDHIASACQLDVNDLTRKGHLIGALCAVPIARLEPGLVVAVTQRDLQHLCDRLGLAQSGSKHQVVARLLSALTDPDVPLSRWQTFEDARDFARSLELTGQSAWYAYVKGGLADKPPCPEDIPKGPHDVYANQGWISWGDFLGTGNPARQLVAYRPFAQAREFARSLGLRDVAEWLVFVQTRMGNRRLLPPDIPAAPHWVYRDAGWTSYGDWLGTGRLGSQNRVFRSYEEARAFARQLGIRTEPEWRAYCRNENGKYPARPPDIPSNPSRAYRDAGWSTWGDFLGSNTIAAHKRSFLSFKDARAFARGLGFRSHLEWRAWCQAGKRPPNIPAGPDQIYRDRGWKGWGDFLGTGNVRRGYQTWSYEAGAPIGS